MALKYDLVLKNGHVIDPSQSLNGVKDVAFLDGRVAETADQIAGEESRRVLDISGKYVAPGLVDVHGHYYQRVHPYSVGADEACLPNGVTTTVDAGSSGWTHFEGLRRYVIETQRTRLMALVNLSALGMLHAYREGGFGPTLGPSISVGSGPEALLPAEAAGELLDLRFAQVEEAVQCIRENPSICLGVKIRLDVHISGERNTIPAMERARQVAELTDSFIMVHVARVPIPLAKVFEYLRPGDIVTHIFHSAEHNILDESGKVRSEAWEAKSKGIVMDIGADKGNIGIDLSRRAIEQGYLPDTISSDVTKKTPGRSPYVLPEVMSLYMALGMSLEDVIAATTWHGAKAIGRENALGTLKKGAAGDAVVFEMESGDFAYDDGDGLVVRTDRRFLPLMTIKDGEVWKPASE